MRRGQKRRKQIKNPGIRRHSSVSVLWVSRYLSLQEESFYHPIWQKLYRKKKSFVFQKKNVFNDLQTASVPLAYVTAGILLFLGKIGVIPFHITLQGVLISGAIARDSAGSGENTSSLSITVGSLSNGVVIAYGMTSSSATTGPSMSFGGSSMTQVGSMISSGSGGSMTAWIFLNPSSGSKTISYSWTTGSAAGICAESLSGVTQSTTVDSTASIINGSGGGASTTLTTVAANCWAVSGYRNINGGTASNGPGWAIQSNSFSAAIGDSGNLASSGAYTIGYGNSGGGGNVVLFFIVGLSPVTTQQLTRTMSDSISVGASRTIVLTSVKNLPRIMADSIINGASRFATIATLRNVVRNMTDSVLVGANRSATVVRSQILSRPMSDSVSVGAGRTTTLLGFQPVLAPVITFRKDSDPTQLLGTINYIQTKDSGGPTLPVRQDEISDPYTFRIYNNYALHPMVGNAYNVSITTYDAVGTHTAVKIPVSQKWVHLQITGFGEGSSAPGNLSNFYGKDLAVGGALNTYVPELGSDGNSVPTLYANPDGTLLSFYQIKTYAEVPSGASTATYTFAISMEYDYF